MTSSIRLAFRHIVGIKPWNLLDVMSAEFVEENDPDRADFIQSGLGDSNEIGVILFNKRVGILHRDDDGIWLRFEDGLIFTAHGN